MRTVWSSAIVPGLYCRVKCDHCLSGLDNGVLPNIEKSDRCWLNRPRVKRMRCRNKCSLSNGICRVFRSPADTIKRRFPIRCLNEIPCHHCKIRQFRGEEIKISFLSILVCTHVAENYTSFIAEYSSRIQFMTWLRCSLIAGDHGEFSVCCEIVPAWTVHWQTVCNEACCFDPPKWADCTSLAHSYSKCSLKSTIISISSNCNFFHRSL